MKFNLGFEIAKSLLVARWRQTLVAAIGVTFSITMFITLLGFMDGLNDLLDGLIINRTPHIRMYNDIKANTKQPINNKIDTNKVYNFIHSIKPTSVRLNIYNAKPIIELLRKDKRVLGVSPKVSAQVFYNVGEIDINGVINGIDVNEEEKLFAFNDYVVQGNYNDLNEIPNSIILGKVAAEKMLASIGDLIQITTAKGERVKLKVVGFFQSGLQDIDKVQSYCSLNTTQKLLGVSNSYYTDIQVKLHNIELAPKTAKEFAENFDIDAIDIQTANSQFETGSFVRTLISYAVGITLLIVAGFGIYNILNMMIYEKMDSIAILKATGFSGNDVKFIFLSIALTIGLIGGISGLIFGFGLSTLIDQIPFNTAALPTVKTYPVSYKPVFYLIGGVFSIVTTYFAGLFPAKRASKIDPVIIIRGK
ncbi:MAG: ABC transporter permease [Crocinitomicaceae bacterium]|jgi:lipoprotein-releasing system permease protein